MNCFVISGEFLTDLSRKLWADDREPEKALHLLESAFPDMSSSIIMSILIGEQKLVGDSNIGITIESDNQTHTEYGHDLKAESIFKHFREKIDELEDQFQMAAHITEFVPSAKGLIEVPTRRTNRYIRPAGEPIALKRDVDLEKIPYRESCPIRKMESMFCPTRETERNNLGLETSLDPPEAFNEITQDNGWLSPEGKFYPCSYGQHVEIAIRLGFDSIQIEKLGYLKVQNSQVFLSTLYNNEPSQSQRDIIFDYYKITGYSLPFWMLPE
jgi:hypothetical protein